MRRPEQAEHGGQADPLVRAAERLKQAEAARLGRNPDLARKICTELLREFPDYVGALHTFGLALADMEQYEPAATALSKAALLCPSDWRVLTALGGVNIRLDRPDAAVGALTQAADIKGDDPSILGTLGEAFRHQRDYESAIRNFEGALLLDPSLVDVKLLLADCCEQVGLLDRAAELYRTSLSSDHAVSAGFRLANLPAAFQPENDTGIVDFDNATSPALRGSAMFARALAAHRAGDHNRAWELLIRANTLQGDVAVDRWRAASIQREKMLAFAAKVEPPVPAPHDASHQPLSLFILGPSRSGKTTLERLMSTAEGVKRGYENPIVENATRRALQTSGFITRLSLNGMPPGLDATFRTFYTADLVKRAAAARVFTNTHPGKIAEILRYAQVIPGARFVFVKRNAEDLMVRIYMKNYESGNDYAHDIRTISEHLEWYNRMIDLSAEKLPAQSLVISYEDMVADPTATRAAVCRLCDIDEDFGELPTIGDDRGIAKPYRAHLARALSS